MADQVQISQGKQAKYVSCVFKEPLVPHLLVMPQVLHHQESMLTFGSYLALLVIVFHVFRGKLIMSTSFTVNAPFDSPGFILFFLLFTGIGSITVNSLFLPMQQFIHDL